MYDPVANEAADDSRCADASQRHRARRARVARRPDRDARARCLHRVRFLKPESPFRSRWSYQNMMFLAAGQAAGKAMNTTWDELVKTAHLHAARHDVDGADLARS